MVFTLVNQDETMLRDYQREAIDNIHAGWQRSRRELLVMPTGGGKTFTAIGAIGNRTALWVTHTRDLVSQTVASFRRRGINASPLMAGAVPDHDAQVIVGTVQSLEVATIKERRDVVVLDEAHHYPDSNHWSIIRYKCPGARLLGLTATPARPDGEPLGDVFDDIVVGAKLSRLIADGVLIQPSVHHAPEPLGSDLALDVVDAIESYCFGRGTFCFVPRVEIGADYRSRLKLRGINAEVVSYQSKPMQRAAALRGLSDGTVDVLISVDALTEGVDIPSASACVIARNYGHVSQLIQAAGRVMRKAEGKDSAIILDLTGVTHRLGSPSIDREYSLTDTPIGGADEPPPADEGDNEDRKAREYTVAQDVLGLPLLPMNGAPPLVGRQASALDRLRHSWDSMLRMVTTEGGSKREAASQFLREHGVWPPGYVVT